MSANGIWKVEMLGPYGWESVATAFLHDGEYRAASQDHYSLGSYQVDGDRIEISASSHVHGQVRTLFGEKRTKIDMRFAGRIEDNLIRGEATTDETHYTLTFRATRLSEQY